MCSFTWSKGHIYDRYACLILYELCFHTAVTTYPDLSAPNPPSPTPTLQYTTQAKVITCENRPTTRIRPTPMNTIELQKRASRFLGLSSDRTMAVAESLYQKGESRSCIPVYTCAVFGLSLCVLLIGV